MKKKRVIIIDKGAMSEKKREGGFWIYWKDRDVSIKMEAAGPKGD